MDVVLYLEEIAGDEGELVVNPNRITPFSVVVHPLGFRGEATADQTRHTVKVVQNAPVCGGKKPFLKR